MFRWLLGLLALATLALGTIVTSGAAARRTTAATSSPEPGS